MVLPKGLLSQVSERLFWANSRECKILLKRELKNHILITKITTSVSCPRNHQEWERISPYSEHTELRGGHGRKGASLEPAVAPPRAPLGLRVDAPRRSHGEREDRGGDAAVGGQTAGTRATTRRALQDDRAREGKPEAPAGLNSQKGQTQAQPDSRSYRIHSRGMERCLKNKA